MEDMEGDWEVIDEVGDSDGPSQDDPSFEASRLVEEEGLEQEIGEIGDQSVNEQSIDQQIENLDGLTVTVGPNSVIRTVKASRLTSELHGQNSCLQLTILLVISHMKLYPWKFVVCWNEYMKYCVVCLFLPITTWSCRGHQPLLVGSVKNSHVTSPV
jgi:hypothetical protein